MISKHIAKLEKELSVQLLYRTTRRLTLTEAGIALVQCAKMVSQLTAEVIDAVYPFTKHLPNKVKLLIGHIKQGYSDLSHYF